MARRELGATAIQETPSYIPSPTAEDFILACRHGPPLERRVLIIMGNRGSGKTSAAIAAILTLGDRLREETPHLLPLIVAVVRDSWINLQRTTMQTIREFERRGLAMEWLDQGRQAITASDPAHPVVHWHFFGMDRPADADKYQGFTCDVLWLEEVAAAADLSAGIPAESFGLGITSLRRPGVPKRCLVTMNPPDSDAWILRVEELIEDAEVPHFRVRRWDMGPDEKERHFRRLAALADSDAERDAWGHAADEHQAYLASSDTALRAIGRVDLALRLVGGAIGEVRVGEPVAATFDRTQHVIDRLEPLGSWPILRFWDGGGWPSTVIAQAIGEDGRGGLNILASHTSENTPLEQHIQEWVIPTMQRRGLMPMQRARGAYAQDRRSLSRRTWTYRDIGDPSMQWEGRTVKAENTSGRVIQEMLGAALEPGPVDWDSRREALNAGFYRAGGPERKRFIQIDKRDNVLLIQALGGRFRYPKDMATGRVTQTVEAAKRASGPKFSGVPDALAYGLAVLFPAADWLRATLKRPVPRPPRRTWLSA